MRPGRPEHGAALGGCTRAACATASAERSAVFNGRRRIPGIDLGTTLSIEGMVGEYRGRLTIRNPVYTILAPDADD